MLRMFEHERDTRGFGRDAVGQADFSSTVRTGFPNTRRRCTRTAQLPVTAPPAKPRTSGQNVLSESASNYLSYP